MLVTEMPAERTALIEMVWKRLQELNCNMSIMHYNELMRVMVENEFKLTPENFLMGLEEVGLEPDSWVSMPKCF